MTRLTSQVVCRVGSCGVAKARGPAPPSSTIQHALRSRDEVNEGGRRAVLDRVQLHIGSTMSSHSEDLAAA